MSNSRLKHSQGGSCGPEVIQGIQLTQNPCLRDSPVNVRLYFQVISGF